MEKFNPPAELSFDTDANLSSTWKKWKDHFRFFLTATESEGKTDKIQTSMLLTTIGPKGRELYESFDLSEDDKFKLEPVLKKFDEHCNPRKNLTILRNKFLVKRQDEDQSFNDFVADLKRLSTDCEFGAIRDDLVKDMIVTGVHDTQLRERLLRTTDLDYATAVKVGVAYEESKLHTSALKKSMKVDKIKHSNRSSNRHFKPGGSGKPGGKSNWQSGSSQQNEINNCRYCGGSHRRGKCPAYGEVCNNCKKKNHFSSCCRSKGVNNIQEEEGYTSDSEEEEFVIKAVRKYECDDLVSMENIEDSEDEILCEAEYYEEFKKSLQDQVENVISEVDEIITEEEKQEMVEIEVMENVEETCKELKLLIQEIEKSAEIKVIEQVQETTEFEEIEQVEEAEEIEVIEYVEEIQEVDEKGEIVMLEDNNEGKEFVIRIINSIGSKKKEWTLDMMVSNSTIEFKLDTGAECNVISISDLKKIFPKAILKKSNVRLRAYNESLIPTCGKTVLPITRHGKTYHILFIVVEEELAPILGLNTIEHMDLIRRVEKVKQIHQAVRNLDEKREVNKILKDLENNDPKYHIITEKYDPCFQPLSPDGSFGTLPRVHHMKVKDDINPVVVPPRKIAHALKPKVKAKLDKMVAEGIITKVEEPTEWVSGMVIVEKTNGDIRICIDPRQLNKAIKRQHHKMPTTDEILAEMADAKFFSKVDASSGYWQIQVSDESTNLLTFATPWGRYKFLRLPFGIHSATEVFQVEVANIIAGLTGCVNLQDDIIIWGRTQEEHDKNLEKVMDRILESGLKLNKKKCVFGTTEMTFLGHIVSADGVKPDPEKIKAIVDMNVPKAVNELQRFLGMINYVGKFIPNLAEIAAPLRSLLKKENEFLFQKPQIDAFEKLKAVITSPPILKFFNPNQPARVRCDASENGLGALLEQFDKNWHPVAYASRSCTPTEKAYASIEREALSILFGCKRFHEYIYGRKFTVFNDHKPLQVIFKKQITECPPRIQRFLYQLQKYDFVLEYSPGKTMVVSDTLSRAPIQDNRGEIDPNDMIHHINSVIRDIPISEERLKQFREESDKDEVIQDIKKCIQQGWPQNSKELSQNVMPYFTFREELSIVDGLLMKGTRIVVPKSLRKEMKKIIHQGHMGIETCRRRARQAIYWPLMNQDIAEMVSKCDACTTYRNKLPKQELIHHQIPSTPWTKLGADLFSLKKREFMVLVDYMSKFVVVAQLERIDSPCVIKKLKNIFACHGIPKELFSDGGPQFTSSLFNEFSKQWDFKHNRSSPHYPQSNGQAERTVQTVKKALKKALETGEDPYLALLTINNTPDASGVSPAERLFGRQTRTQMPSMQPNRFATNEGESMQKPVECKDIQPGTPVRIRYDTDRSWSRGGQVVRKRVEPRSYDVRNDNGNVVRVNERHLLPCTQNDESEPVHIKIEDDTPDVLDHTINEDNTGAPTSTTGAAAATNIQPEGTVTTRSGRTINKPSRYR